MLWEKIPENRTSKIRKNNNNFLLKEREELKKYIESNIKSLSIQAMCSLDCTTCNVHLVIECYDDNQHGNYI